VIKDVRSKLHLNAVAVQVPIGLEKDHQGVVDLVSQDAIFFRGENGEVIS
jgi:elongation factor G